MSGDNGSTFRTCILGLVAISTSGCAPSTVEDAAPIMSFEEYARDQHETPYVVRITQEDLELIYYGARHSFDPTDPMFDEPETDAGRRERLRRHLTSFERTKLERWARVLDPDRATLAAEGGPQRLARTVEVPLLTGRPLSWWHEYGAPEAEAMAGVVVVLDLPREELDDRIDARIVRMLKAGLVGEVEQLIAAGHGPDAPGMTGTGYREIGRCLGGK